MKSDYENLLMSVKNLEEKYQSSFKQIWKDVVWTFQKHQIFKFGSVQQRLEWVLKCLVISFPKIGYVQGMNYIVATLLYHCNESTSYWLSHALLEKYGL